jgi:hypothetical protein
MSLVDANITELAFMFRLSLLRVYESGFERRLKYIGIRPCACYALREETPLPSPDDPDALCAKKLYSCTLP